MGFHVNTASRLPIYRQLVHQIREAIARGDLQPEERLPSVRQLSSELVINPNTVARAYLELERSGVLVSRAGLGMFVAQPRTELTKEVRQRRLSESLDHWLTEAVHLGFSAQEVVGLVTKRVAEFQWNSDGPKSKGKGPL
jgi:GntR family transcriptional regulator